MALLDNITYSPGEPMQNAFDKMNAAIDQINSILGGGATGQVPRKVDETDFNFAFYDSLKWKTVNIGNWNMDVDAGVTISHGVSGDKIKVIDVIIIKNDGSHVPFQCIDATTGAVAGGFSSVTALGTGYIALSRTIGGVFDGTDFNATTFNRGYLTIGYID